MTYEEFIQGILNTRGRFACGDKYHERHHIIPVCINGSDDKENLIDLFAREHFEAHRLLALENPNNDKLVYAWHMMSIMNDNNKRIYEITSEEYEEARISFINSLSSNMSGENNIMYGKYHSEETRQKIGEKAKIRYEDRNNHPMFGKHHNEDTKKIISDKAKDRYKSPEDNPMYGKKQSEKTKMAVREAQSKPVVQLTKSGELIAEYKSGAEAERITGVLSGGISSCCVGRYISAGGFLWVNKNEYDPLYSYSYDERKEFHNKKLKEKKEINT